MRHLAAAVLVALTIFLLEGTILAGEHEGHGVQESQGDVVQTIGQYRWLLYTVSGIFCIAVMHTFCVGKFQKIAHDAPVGSIKENVFHLLGEVEAVFLLWSGVLLTVIACVLGWGTTVGYVESRNFTEPQFVFVIMTIAATRPVIDAVDALIRGFARLLFFLPPGVAFIFSALFVGPLLGSFVTEPAAMTVTAFVLRRQYFERGITRRFMYAILGVLFVNVSIGGVLTHYAAPPVLMVASTWGWDQDPTFMFRTFGYKAIIAVAVNAAALCVIFRAQLRCLAPKADSDAHNGDAAEMAAPVWVILVHLAFIAFTVLNAHHAKMFMGGFLFFLAFAYVTQEFQEKLKLRESLLVAGFLAGLVTLGGLQRWWLEPILGSLSAWPLFVGATALTAVTDNAALTYLGSLVSGLSAKLKYALVAGAVTGGGLTVIANAPNPAGYSILNGSFKDEERGIMGISPMGLLTAALAPTMVAGFFFWMLPPLW